MLKIFRSKLFISIVCLAVAAVVCFLLLPRIYQNQNKVETVAKLKSDVAYGTQITSDMVITAEVGTYGLPSDLVKDKAEIVGKYAASKLYAGDFITPTKLMSEDVTKNFIRSKTDGDYEVLVTINMPTAAAGVAGVLRSGDIVDVYKLAKATNTTPAAVYKVATLNSLRVYDVLNKNYKSLTELDESASKSIDLASSAMSSDFTPQYIVFAVTEAQALELLNLEATGTVHLVYKKGE